MEIYVASARKAYEGQNRLPLIAPLLVYNGTKKYDSPRNLWDLFIAPKQARKLMTEDYRLIDLQSMPDDEIKKKQHLGMLEYFLKHIHQRDMLKLWGEFLEEFKEVVLIDKANGYIYLKQFIWYQLCLFIYLKLLHFRSILLLLKHKNHVILY